MLHAPSYGDSIELRSGVDKLAAGDKAFDKLLEKALAFSVPRNRRWFQLLHGKGAEGAISWRVNGEEVTFLVHDKPRLHARFQLVGLHYHKDNLWRWAWAEPGATDEKCNDALVVRRYGQEHGIPQLTSPELAADAQLPMRLTALAVMLNDGDGAFPLVLRQGVFDLVVLHSIREADASA